MVWKTFTISVQMYKQSICLFFFIKYREINIYFKDKLFYFFSSEQSETPAVTTQLGNKVATQGTAHFGRENHRFPLHQASNDLSTLRDTNHIFCLESKHHLIDTTAREMTVLRVVSTPAFIPHPRGNRKLVFFISCWLSTEELTPMGAQKMQHCSSKPHRA